MFWHSTLNDWVNWILLFCLAGSEGMDWKDISKKGVHSHIPQQRAQQVSNSVVIVTLKLKMNLLKIINWNKNQILNEKL